ncbi:DUF294 nucleotidyltransferase-like domain-containing protein [Arenicella xantha]|uniref:Cyclic nucleotide-binding protein n=1 Tax=Arenicella xantha TaxID=644221 RepID=A0A395JKK7_9GAMM|nr:DUF294 nucleotidyltransferase-like domain-containing protein [Arenicella xantha]RBP51323.1 cyclic nucleotide-binding protein [Arenicella xantha]
MTSCPPELTEVVGFLSQLRPFDQLENDTLLHAARQLKTTYHQANSQEQILDYNNPTLFIVRTGVFDVRNADGDLLDRVTEGGFFGFLSLLTGDSGGHTLHVFEDGLLHRLDQQSFRSLRKASDEFDQYFVHAFEQRLRVGLSKREENSAWATRIDAIMSPRLVSATPEMTIQHAAQIMTTENVASLAILNEQSDLVGIFTDKDCRKRVIAQNVDTQQAIESVMTGDPITIDHMAMVHEANILMIRHQIKHLPVTVNGQVQSMVTLSDLIRLQRSDPVLIIGEIHRAKQVDELKKISEKIPELLLHLIKLDVRADDLGRILTSVTSALTRHLITLAQQQFGPPPLPFVWLAFGSQGRQDQSAKSDQDNGLLLAQEPSPEQDHYFKQLAEFVNFGLDACGYVYCPGGIMAQTDEWRLSLSAWQHKFHNWINEPSSDALMRVSIFFDMRPIVVSAGAENLFADLQNPILDLARDNSIFLSLLTQNANDIRPPLGVFSQLMVERGGEHKHTLDVKKRGIMPINDIARIHALANGVSAVNTRDRLEEVIRLGALNEHDGRNLLDAHEYIAHQRLLHQGEQLKRSQAPDNHLNPKDFSALTNRHLKDAFKVVSDAQTGLKQAYGGGIS